MFFFWFVLKDSPFLQYALFILVLNPHTELHKAEDQSPNTAAGLLRSQAVVDPRRSCQTVSWGCHVIPTRKYGSVSKPIVPL